VIVVDPSALIAHLASSILTFNEVLAREAARLGF
jgi:hypothetical protein